MAGIKMGSDESHFNVSLIGRDKVTIIDSVHKPQLLKRKESRSGIEPRSFRLPALQLGQTGSCEEEEELFCLLSPTFLPQSMQREENKLDSGHGAAITTQQFFGRTDSSWDSQYRWLAEIHPHVGLMLWTTKKPAEITDDFKASAARSVDFLAPSVVLA